MTPPGGPDDPSDLPSATGLAKGAAEGVGAAVASTAKGLYDLGATSAGGYKQLAEVAKQLATDPQAREEAYEAVKDAAKAAKEGAKEAAAFGQYLADDPQGALETAKDGALTAANYAKTKGKELLEKEKQDFAAARAKGEGSEFVGKAVGRTAAEIAPFLIGVGEAAESGKLAEVAELSKMEKADTVVLPCGKVVPREGFSGGNPTIAGDVAHPDVVNARSADFAKLYADDPLRGTMDNPTARQWYLDQEAAIPSKLDQSKSLEEQARQACALRNTARTRARELMSDRITADRLSREEINRTFDDLVAQRKAAGLKGDDVYKSIIASSQKSRASVNNALGVRAKL